MKEMLESTASSCGVAASAISRTAPTPFWMVSSSVSPVNTRMVSCCSSGVSVAQDGMSLESGTFSGSQKLLVRRFQTSRSLSSSMRFQLMARTRARGHACMFMDVDLRSEGAGDAALHLGAFERQLTETDVVDGLDALLPGVDLGAVD